MQHPHFCTSGCLHLKLVKLLSPLVDGGPGVQLTGLEGQGC